MNTFNHIRATLILVLFFSSFCSLHAAKNMQMLTWVDHQLLYCDTQVRRTLTALPNDSMLPRSIDARGVDWHTVDAYDWTSGFWPGTLWYDYENQRRPDLLQKAEHYTHELSALLSPNHVCDHDIGFQLLCSFGNAWRITGNDQYRRVLLEGANRLARLYNSRVGTILSWPHMVRQGWPYNTIMDNMMNLQLLFFAAKYGGDPKYYDMAISHARKTMRYQFRPDGTNYHVALYDSIDGRFLCGITNQGYSDNSCWARGQAWAVYGYTEVYFASHDKTFLRFVEKLADVYLKRLPEDYIPYWDFDDPNIPHAPRDASAAAIMASALFKLSQIEDNADKSRQYLDAAVNMLQQLSSDRYQSGNRNPSFLLHSTGNLPAHYEIDASINYADYYYIEALTRYKRILGRV